MDNLDVGKGNNKLTVSGGTVKVTNGNLSLAECTGNGNLTIAGGTVSKITGNGKVNIVGGSVSEITGTGAADVISVANQQQQKIVINAGNGANVITVAGKDNDVASATSRGKIITGNGNDTITVNNGGFYWIDSGAGKDAINIKGGSNIIRAGAGDDNITIESKRANYVDAGAGKDTITLNGSSKYNYIIGGDDGDTIIINNTNKNLIEGGAGTDTYKIYSADSNKVIIDNSEAAKGDELKLYSNKITITNSIDLLEKTGLQYDINNDVVKCCDFYIVGFSTLGNIYFNNDDPLGTGEDFAKTVKTYYNNPSLAAIIPNYDKYASCVTTTPFSDIDSINNVKDQWNQITGYAENTLGFTSDSHAQFAGYQKK